MCADAHDAPPGAGLRRRPEHRTIKLTDRAARAPRRVEPHRPDAEPFGVAARREVFRIRIRKGLKKIVGGDEPEAVAEGTFKRSDAREGRAPLGQPRVEALHLMTRPGEDDLSS